LPEIIEKILARHDSIKDPSLDDILQADLWARRETKKIMGRIIK